MTLRVVHCPHILLELMMGKTRALLQCPRNPLFQNDDIDIEWIINGCSPGTADQVDGT
jgi:hypothetical protein